MADQALLPLVTLYADKTREYCGYGLYELLADGLWQRLDDVVYSTGDE